MARIPSLSGLAGFAEKTGSVVRGAGLLGLITGGLVAVFVFIAGWALFANDPLGGEPHAIVSLQQPAPPTAGEGDTETADAMRPSVSGEDGGEGQSAPQFGAGGQSGTIGGQVVISDPLAAADGADKELVETGRHGPLPRIAEDGRRPMNVYARPAPEITPGQPRIALVITGMGLSTAGTEAAIRRLPADFTLAFAPYGRDVRRLSRLARDEGHELLLQLPLEPYDYPDSDPGPHTLLASLPERQNIDRLHWLMARIVGYAGVLNHLGAKFLADENALRPVLEEVRNRGLIYVDDATAPQNRTPGISERLGLPRVKADKVVDRVPTREAIDASLAELIAIATDRGYAIGVASALPGTISAIEDWISVLERRNIAVVPVTMLAMVGPS